MRLRRAASATNFHLAVVIAIGSSLPEVKPRTSNQPRDAKKEYPQGWKAPKAYLRRTKDVQNSLESPRICCGP